MSITKTSCDTCFGSLAVRRHLRAVKNLKHAMSCATTYVGILNWKYCAQIPKISSADFKSLAISPSEVEALENGKKHKEGAEVNHQM